MTTVIIDNKSRIGRKLLKEIEKHPRVAHIVSDERDKTPLPVPEEDLISLDEFKKNFEDAILEDLGLKVQL
ncbi:hypothetical protein M2459_001095 [Parabacteroides sp. PF5-5]|uniref:hypothetical protein n=1 Tax=unclassified Parabacteroides TaxID=2649774 RepID=UPI0024767F6B|nr:MULTISPECIES: hypothetical protein [unclassified Parabacteroides]MDH6304362.1 hypothetical protein [Parabacteroides sp. PH5-39]MDH6315485.1 hypothetical protein [Parabacteroides sp. PF5-13]MDH6319021.1 hypothetical protein [Parabacteroides sp. PH5-13]MDH6322751.1 hypothetical protein [Parabacteroides sp. PH5-8]MDH6326677.1 hypothetical protein [Parabacteroides sp. PH5-41]